MQEAQTLCYLYDQVYPLHDCRPPSQTTIHGQQLLSIPLEPLKCVHTLVMLYLCYTFQGASTHYMHERLIQHHGPHTFGAESLPTIPTVEQS